MWNTKLSVYDSRGNKRKVKLQLKKNETIKIKEKPYSFFSISTSRVVEQLMMFH